MKTFITAVALFTAAVFAQGDPVGPDFMGKYCQNETLKGHTLTAKCGDNTGLDPISHLNLDNCYVYRNGVLKVSLYKDMST
jgi:hypothetical protein